MLATSYGADTLTKTVKIGKPINAGDAVSKSARILFANPHIILPQVILLVVTLVNDAVTASIFSALSIIITVIQVVLFIVVAGAYPFIVKATINGEKWSLGEALGKAYRRFWTLLAAGILVALVVGLGLIALVVPGIILATWYAYTVPAIMLEDKGAREGMAASKAFGRDKKGDTFLIFIAIAVVGLILLVFQYLFFFVSPLAGKVVYALLDLPVGAWVSVMLAYVYITHGPSSVALMTDSATAASAEPSTPPQIQPEVPPVPTAGYCRFCGTPLQAGSKFCPSCGKPI